MSRILPTASNPLNSPSHSFLHRVISVDTGSPQSSIDVDASGNVAIGVATVSTIVLFDASKNLISADVTTYPSLTELTYLKGVTSVIQTQINAKGVGTIIGSTGSTDKSALRANGTGGITLQASALVLSDVVSKNAILDFSLLATSDKTFKFPNASGTFPVFDTNYRIFGDSANPYLRLSDSVGTQLAYGNTFWLLGGSSAKLVINNSFGVLFVTSSLSADRTFTYPNSSGTFALTSDLSSYVPYTGASGSVDLGAFNIKATSMQVVNSIYDGGGTGIYNRAFDVANRAMYDDGDTIVIVGTQSLRSIVNKHGNTMGDFTEDLEFFDQSNASALVIKTTDRILRGFSGDDSIEFGGRIMYASGGSLYPSLNWDLGTLIHPTGGAATLDWKNSRLLFSTAGIALDWSTGIISKYNDITTTGNGVPIMYATPANLTAQSAAIAATTIYAVPATGAGMYRVNWVATITTAATTSSVLGGAAGFQVKFTNNTDSVVKTSNPTNITSSAGNTTTTTVSGAYIANCKASTNLQYIMGYTSIGVTAMVYDLSIKVEYLG